MCLLQFSFKNRYFLMCLCESRKITQLRATRFWAPFWSPFPNFFLLFFFCFFSETLFQPFFPFPEGFGPYFESILGFKIGPKSLRRPPSSVCYLQHLAHIGPSTDGHKINVFLFRRPKCLRNSVLEVLGPILARFWGPRRT